MNDQTPSGAPSRTEFDLARFFPYRLAVLAEAVSRAVAQVYEDRFGLTRAEWRLLAALGASRRMAAKDLGRYSALDKMQVSRAVVRLEAAGHVQREEDPRDRRAKILRLTPAGASLYARIVPLVAARERYLLEAMSVEERELLGRLMSVVLERADRLVSRG